MIPLSSKTIKDSKGVQAAKSILEGYEEGYSKKPRNMDEMIVLYMEMHISHKVMESRIEKLESRLNTMTSLIFKGEKQL